MVSLDTQAVPGADQSRLLRLPFAACVTCAESWPSLHSEPEHLMRTLQLFLLAVVLHLAAPEPAHAYIDPSAGSMVIQVVAGVILGGLLTIRRWWTGLGQAAKLVWASIRRS
jgi:hypothetical protein